MMTTLARYVYVYLEGDDHTLTLCELEVYGHRGRAPFFSEYSEEYNIHWLVAVSLLYLFISLHFYPTIKNEFNQSIIKKIIAQAV